MLRGIVVEMGMVSKETLEPGIGTGACTLHPSDFAGP
jgi:hypothetical protein